MQIFPPAARKEERASAATPLRAHEASNNSQSFALPSPSHSIHSSGNNVQGRSASFPSRSLLRPSQPTTLPVQRHLETNSVRTTSNRPALSLPASSDPTAGLTMSSSGSSDCRRATYSRPLSPCLGLTTVELVAGRNASDSRMLSSARDGLKISDVPAQDHIDVVARTAISLVSAFWFWCSYGLHVIWRVLVRVC